MSVVVVVVGKASNTAAVMWLRSFGKLSAETFIKHSRTHSCFANQTCDHCFAFGTYIALG